MKIMKARLLAILVLMTLLCPVAVGADTQAKIKLFMIITDPWAQIIGGDSPRLALYDDGTVIYRAAEEKGAPFYSAKLSNEEQSALMKLTEPLSDLKKWYQIKWATDQPTNMIWYRNGEKSKIVKVYGRMNQKIPAGMEMKTEKMPDSLQKAFDGMSVFKNASAKPWLPDYLELIVYPFDYCKKKPVPWPTNWPTTKDKRTKKVEDTYYMFLPKSEYGKLQEVLKQCSDDRAVTFGGKKWALGYRFPFPDEKAIQEAKK